ncbi:carbohydrate ABC transporter permease [Desulfurobacterium atlanticum]|uniref:Carbohydrate ABC transporter membrane protein 1, CUT1 family n=1 Tax=Desulfurobacterium atlanticum TaxID=240169 RepID=A0A238YEG5_9BACT|nr:sugar ABC transporter permease [Desulfurobacterium atlanticum]SNR68749.1 carbohydrate ABC transporter membrane protein 1, CUT1 family [Desulfurobacterium atlanticum]
MGGLVNRVRAILKLHFIVPFLFLVVVFYFIPVIITFLISFTNMSSYTGFSNWHWVEFKNYEFIFKNPETVQHFWITVKYVVCTLLFFNVGLAFILALATTHISRKWGYFFRSLWLLPRITPVVVYIMMWQFLVADAPYGVINQLFIKPLGLQPQNWLAVVPFLMIVLVNGFVGASFGMIIFTSAIESIPKDIMNASLIDGATIFQRIRYVIVPYLKWPLLFVLTYQTLSLLTSFEQILILTNGEFGTEVWALWAYHKALSNYWGNFQWGFGMALSAVLVIVGVIFSIIYMRFFKFKELVKRPKIETL